MTRDQRDIVYRCDQCGEEADFDEFAFDDECHCGGNRRPVEPESEPS